MNETAISFRFFRATVLMMAVLLFATACGGGEKSNDPPPPSSGVPSPPPVTQPPVTPPPPVVTPPTTPVPVIDEDHVFIIYARSTLEESAADAGIIRINNKNISEQDFYYVELERQVIYVLSKNLLATDSDNHLYFEIPVTYNELSGLTAYIDVNISTLEKNIVYTSIYHTAASDILKHVKSEGLDYEKVAEFLDLSGSLSNLNELSSVANTSYPRSLLDQYLFFASNSNYAGVKKVLEDISNAAQELHFTVESGLAKLPEKTIEIEVGAVLGVMMLCPNKAFNGIDYLELTAVIDLNSNDEQCLYKYAFCYEGSEEVEPVCGSFKEAKLTHNYNKETIQIQLSVRDSKTDELFTRATELSLGKPDKVRQIVYCALLRQNNYSCES
ncbi:hypothetical protein EMM73_06590 [Rheinheimera sediminis]|uniref:hypothetical protein n=1 Tax=Rheinheimera sp. YQF-1 TaxID=2499626 RepID=UPI000FD8A9A5|nr:hypothetical protein [Rheinheimera sp. YQF-1]RVT46850.1 hypothetical protein EMM73_06590 [Rheinheimera sp. YQF-1]